jgi:hypothetical protein
MRLQLWIERAMTNRDDPPEFAPLPPGFRDRRGDSYAGPVLDVQDHYTHPRLHLDGRTYILDGNEEAERVARECGIRSFKMDHNRLSRTPPQDHIGDPYVVDPRPIRVLTEEQKNLIRSFIRKGFFVRVAGFETWRGRDRHIYLDVLAFTSDAGPEPDEDWNDDGLGTPVGPITEEWMLDMRMVGDQLAVRMLDPNGHCRPSGGSFSSGTRVPRRQR